MNGGEQRAGFTFRDDFANSETLGLSKKLRRPVHGAEEDWQVGQLGRDLAGGGEAVHDRHREIEDYDVRLKLEGFRNRFGSVGGFEDLVIWRFQNLMKGGPDQSVVVGDQDSNWHRKNVGPFSGAEIR